MQFKRFWGLEGFRAGSFAFWVAGVRIVGSRVL